MDVVAKDGAARYRAPALDKGLDILEVLAATEEGLSQAEIAKALDRTPNEIYRMLDRLTRRQYVRRTSSDRYELSLKLFTLVHQHAPIRRLVPLAMPELREFSRCAQQACHLAIYDRGNVAVIAQVDAPGYWGFSIRVGSAIGLFNTGSGHVLLAFASPRERATMTAEHQLMPHETIPPDLEERLARVKAQGWEIMQSQQTVGVSNLSVPVSGPNGSVIAALTCPYLERLDNTHSPNAEEVIALLRAAAARIRPDGGA
ncbi:MAG TPA: IclR family transcriptional regulator [Acidisoma sp.]|jgi:DNA-binding IclR family transcriptional regulator|uniref:IclR family transcriptional regulator n=1 Tax=Acidisoma sp. TaxID=1872115 RepID=UPI002B8A7D86|nr:IclR family transcriptional regulator [Acidisoma sp.]HTI01631.1 IclR family transcriptional regulator [Acidisoma sp.]